MRRALGWLLALILVGGCATPQPTPVPPTATPRPEIAETPAPTLRPTGTPAPIATARPTATPTSTPLPVQANDLNLLLLGTDRRLPNEPTWRTDTIIVVAVRPRHGLIAMLSIPRDLWVTIPGHGQNRINVVDYLGERSGGPGGGTGLVAATLRQNLGITVNACARIQLEGLARVIDTLGGITITSDRAYDEWFWDETAPNGVSHMVVVTGTQRMDGRLALQYARARHGTGDFDRSRRQQQILLALREAALRPEVLPRLPALVGQLADTIDTDLRLNQALPLLGLALRLRPEAFRSQVFDYTMVRNWTTPDGAQVLLPNRPRIEAVWQELTAPTIEPQTDTRKRK